VRFFMREIYDVCQHMSMEIRIHHTNKSVSSESEGESDPAPESIRIRAIGDAPLHATVWTCRQKDKGWEEDHAGGQRERVWVREFFRILSFSLLLGYRDLLFDPTILLPENRPAWQYSARHGFRRSFSNKISC
jgi:hypothetical protein